MTPERLKDYLRNTELCPYCGAKNVQVVTVSQRPDIMIQHYFCHDCDKVWFGKFTLTLINTGEI